MDLQSKLDDANKLNNKLKEQLEQTPPLVKAHYSNERQKRCMCAHVIRICNMDMSFLPIICMYVRMYVRMYVSLKPKTAGLRVRPYISDN